MRTESKIWILFSSDQNRFDEHNYFQQVFWEKPTWKTISEYLAPGVHTLLPAHQKDFENISNGVKSFIYGEIYWVEEFTQPIKNQTNEEESIETPSFTGLLNDYSDYDGICPI